VVARHLAVPAAVAVAAVAVVAALVAIALRDSGPGAATEREASVRPTVRATFEPEVHGFGEPVTARLELLVRRSELELSTLRPVSNFEPYDVVGPARREVVDFGALQLVRYTILIQCLKQACLPETQTGQFEFAPSDPRLGSAGFTWRTPPPPGREFKDRRLDNRSVSGDWPTLKVASRLSPEQLEDAAWRSNLADLPEATFRVAPRALGAGLLGVAAALVLAAAALVGRYVSDVRRRAAAARIEEQEAEPTLLEQALGLLVQARGNGEPGEQRIALETLARELHVHGRVDLAHDAERLAWSAGTPVAVEVDELAETVRRLNGDAS
jgi:hypothetical protein